MSFSRTARGAARWYGFCFVPGMSMIEALRAWAPPTGAVNGRVAPLALLVAAALTAACTSGPEPPVDARARGQALVRAMSDRLVRASAFTVSTRETRTRRAQDAPLQTERTFTVRRPDRIAFTAVGDRLDLRGWYVDGKVTLVSPADKVWARVGGDPTIDGTLDILAERFEMQMPMADFLYSTPYDALMADAMTGGYVGRETIDGVDCDYIRFADEIVEWHLWLPATGEPLPKKYRVIARQMRGQPTSEVLFLEWKLDESPADAAFAPQVPDDFERIAVAAREVAPPADAVTPDTGAGTP